MTVLRNQMAALKGCATPRSQMAAPKDCATPLPKMSSPGRAACRQRVAGAVMAMFFTLTIACGGDTSTVTAAA